MLNLRMKEGNFMPRTARIKTNNSTYHIMIRSISEINLFQAPEDKERYLFLIKKYTIKYNFKLYGYCLMDNHGHLVIDTNGSDISKIMHSINFCYAMYFNKKYNRHGHLFQDRFKSKIIRSKKYLLALTAYIHYNPTAIKKYSDCPQNYKYSSLPIYLALDKDKYCILNTSFVLNYFGRFKKEQVTNYLKFIAKYSLDMEIDKIAKDLEFDKESTQYRSEKPVHKINYTKEEIINYIVNLTDIDSKRLFYKYDRKSTLPKALFIFLMTRYSGYSNKDLCLLIGDLTQSRISKLSSTALNLILTDNYYADLLYKFEQSAS